jgi:ribosome-associated protein
LAAAEAASGKKAERVVILDVSSQLVITDFFVICSGNSDRQVRTIAQEVQQRLAEDHGVKPFRREGEREGQWVLLDYVDFVLHVFQPEDREYYDLERLWADAEKTEIRESGAVEVAPRMTTREDDWEGDEPAAAEAT